MKKSRLFLGMLLLVAAFLCHSIPAYAASSVSKNGVTWTFDRNYTTGVYCNGDPWVVGPVTITSISPLPVEGRNGTMVNPPVGTSQGFDKDFVAGWNEYVPSMNVGKNLPLTVDVDSSVVSTITADGWTNYDTIQMFSILTVVRNVPEAGSFRPPAVGNGSRDSLWKESQLDYSKLNTLARSPISSAPSLANYVQWFSYPWIELNPNWTGGYLRTSYMAPNGYGRDLAYRTGDAALLLNLDYTNAQKRDLLVGVVQVGIDNYGFLMNGGVWYNDGGHNLGRLSPLIIAAGVLDDPNLKSMIKGSAMKFQEFQSTFFVSLEDVNRTGKIGVNGDPSIPYTTADLGKPEWGIRHTGNPELDNNYISAAYREINGSNHTAPTMAAKVMGLRAVIDWEPLFRYAERHLNYEMSPDYKGEWNYTLTPSFHKQFYAIYKDAVPGSGGTVIPDTPPQPEIVLAVGDRFKTSKDTNIRSTGTLTGSLLGVLPTGSEGTVIGGPIGPDANNIIWWQVDCDNGIIGWCGQDNLVKLDGQPSKPQGLRIVQE